MLFGVFIIIIILFNGHLAEEESVILWAAWLKAARADRIKLVMDWGGWNQEGEDNTSCQIFAYMHISKNFEE